MACTSSRVHTMIKIQLCLKGGSHEKATVFAHSPHRSFFLNDVLTRLAEHRARFHELAERLARFGEMVFAKLIQARCNDKPRDCDLLSRSMVVPQKYSQRADNHRPQLLLFRFFAVGKRLDILRLCRSLHGAFLPFCEGPWLPERDWTRRLLVYSVGHGVPSQ